MPTKLPIILETPRVYFRRPVLADLDDYIALYRRPEVTRYIPDAPRNDQEVQEEVEWFLNGHPRHPELGLWATIHKVSRRFAGRCGLLPWTIEGRDEVEVAYTLAPEFWGQGLATEAARGIVAYAFQMLHLPRLIAMIEPGNTASRRVAEKAGLRLEKQVEGYEGDGNPFFIYSVYSEYRAVYHIRAHLLCHDVRLNTSIETDVLLDRFPSEAEALRLLYPAADAMVTRNFCEGCPYDLSIIHIYPAGPA
jgi:RimJ/RimL family protein N-acetyltransferase